MSRVTRNNGNGTYDVLLEHQLYANKKLGKLEDLEGKLKCSLDFVFKVLKAPKIYVEGMNVFSEHKKGFGFHARYNDYMINPEVLRGKRPEFLFIDRWARGYNLRLKDYKKTWWLREDKSE